MASLQQQIGARLKDLRQLKGYTQAELAQLIELSANYIGSLERGERTVSLQTLERLAHALGVEIDVFFRPRDTTRKFRVLDRNSILLEKLATFLRNADPEDRKLILKLAKHVTRHTRP